MKYSFLLNEFFHISIEYFRFFVVILRILPKNVIVISKNQNKLNNIFSLSLNTPQGQNVSIVPSNLISLKLVICTIFVAPKLHLR